MKLVKDQEMEVLTTKKPHHIISFLNIFFLHVTLDMIHI